MVALFLSGIGTYGVIGYAVSQRRREIGIRVPLGAHPVQIRNQFLSIGVRLLGAETAIGIAGAWLSERAMQAILYNVSAVQALMLAAAVAVMGAVAVPACLIPAARAAKLDPSTHCGQIDVRFLNRTSSGCAARQRLGLIG
jgi:putative ABC transport system permease protein